MPMILEEFPIEAIELNVEISHHPELIRRLNELLIENPGADFYLRIGEVAAYCDILLDGMYKPADIKRLCTILTEKLQDKRSLILLDTSYMTKQ